MQNLWQGHQDNYRKTHWVAWNTIEKSKSEQEMDFRDLESFNLPTLEKAKVDNYSEPSILSYFCLKGKVFSRGIFLSSKTEHQTFQSLCHMLQSSIPSPCQSLYEYQSLQSYQPVALFQFESKWFPSRKGFHLGVCNVCNICFLQILGGKQAFYPKYLFSPNFLNSIHPSVFQILDIVFLKASLLMSFATMIRVRRQNLLL